MQLFVLILTVLGLYVVYRLGLKAWLNSSISDKMDKIEVTEEQYEKVTIFNKNHKNYKEKKQQVDKFKNQ